MLTEIPALFFACCDRDSIRYDLKKPFVFEGFLWATDARICVRQPVEDFSPELLTGIMYERGKLPKIESMWRENAKGDRRTRCDELPQAIWRMPCPELAQHDEMAYCEECDGEGTVLTCDPVPVGELFLIS